MTDESQNQSSPPQSEPAPSPASVPVPRIDEDGVVLDYEPEVDPVRITADINHIARTHLRGLVEALIFASDKPLTVSDIAKVAQADRKLVRDVLGEIQAYFQDRGLQLCEVAGGYTFRTSAAFAPFVRDLTGQKPVKLTRAQLETLAIVAYRQPLTRPEIDDVRGVDSGPILKMLLERDLIRILGKRDEPGRPLVYGTTSAFLTFFSLRSLKDLPSLREFTELTDDSRRTYERVLGEEPPETQDSGAEQALGPDAAQPLASDAEPGQSPEPLTQPPAELTAQAPDLAAPKKIEPSPQGADSEADAKKD